MNPFFVTDCWCNPARSGLCISSFLQDNAVSEMEKTKRESTQSCFLFTPANIRSLLYSPLCPWQNTTFCLRPSPFQQLASVTDVPLRSWLSRRMPFSLSPCSFSPPVIPSIPQPRTTLLLASNPSNRSLYTRRTDTTTPVVGQDASANHAASLTPKPTIAHPLAQIPPRPPPAGGWLPANPFPNEGGLLP